MKRASKLFSRSRIYICELHRIPLKILNFNKMKHLFLILFYFLIISAQAQVKLSGVVTSKEGEPITGANLYFVGTYEGCTTDSAGNFSFTSDLAGEQQLIVSFIGFKSQQLTINPAILNQTIKIQLEEEVSEINEVVINAGTFEASDKKKAVFLKPIDIALTAGANGDVYGAFGTMPGSHKVGEEGRLFVRGGESYETKTFMDGMLVNTPYFSKLPDLPTRGRFSPLLFNGSVFSTGGYSAEFGQALSSIVALNTIALEPEDKSTISVLSVGVQGSHAKRWENSSVTLSGEFIHTGLSNKIFKQNIDWINPPIITGSTLLFRQKVGESGMIKTFGSFSYSSNSLRYGNFEESILQSISLKNSNTYINTTYNDMLNEKWMVNTGIAYNNDSQNLHIDADLIKTLKNSGQAKVCFTNFTTDKIQIKTGADYVYNKYEQQISMDGDYVLPFENSQASVFVESDIKINSLIALRFGLRTENSSLLNETSIMPRVSSAIKTGKYSQLSLAYGEFYQNPEEDYLKFSPALLPEKSTHSILTYQYKKGGQTFRLEAYHKKYTNLVKFIDEYSYEPGNFTNDGKGYANGFDIFWRNQKPLGKSDYWISYSWNDTKRDYKDFSAKVTPHFASEHNLSVVYKKLFTELRTFVGFTGSFASGRPYYNPNNPVFMSDKTKSYFDLSMNFTYITNLFNKQAVIHLVVNNLPGFNNIFGYTYNSTPNNQGVFESQPITPASKRMAVILVSFQL